MIYQIYINSSGTVRRWYLPPCFPNYRQSLKRRLTNQLKLLNNSTITMKIEQQLKSKAMTQTTQPHSRFTIEKTEKPELTEAEEAACDLLAVCASLNKLCGALIRLEYAIRKSNIETNLIKRSV